MNLRTVFFLLVTISVIFYLIIPSHYYNKKPTVCISIFKCLSVEIADDEPERAIGLMYRNNLQEDSGMLFIFPEESVYVFWMKNMKIPIDILWIDSNLTVANIEQNVPPCENEPCQKYVPKNKAKYTLETSANFTSENNIDIGDKVEFYNI